MSEVASYAQNPLPHFETVLWSLQKAAELDTKSVSYGV